MRRVRWLLRAGALLVAALPTWAHENHLAEGGAAAAPALTPAVASAPGQAPSARTDWPPAVARFRVVLQRPGQPDRTQQWTLWRDARLIALIKPGEEELWRRDSSGIRLERIYRDERHVIEYSAGELRTLQVNADWLSLGTLFDEASLPLLIAAPKPRTRTGHGTVAYRGRLGAERVDLLWDSAWRMPQRLVRQGPHGTVRFERTAIHAQAPADWPTPGRDTDGYQRIDAADFGDMEGSAFVRQVQAQDVRRGWRQTHPH